MLTRNALTDYARSAPVTVKVGAPVNDEICVMPLSGEGAARVAEAQKEGNEVMMAVLAIAYCLTDEKGSRLFQLSELNTISGLPFRYVKAVGEACLEHCGAGSDADPVEAAAEN